ncbi:PAS-domain containing protein [Paracoccus sp. Z118]|uniref:PAS-domain containing protein n=1 Tax=Paracoccus sp. Z118 TaxID=2851017 RepID=UPI001C2C60A7|nr:PAS-domain containing protein [Paracoccus sp. Z118]MBV0891248.1 PAS-domain containing protein [Paracoccus sp. Z118]
MQPDVLTIIIAFGAGTLSVLAALTLWRWLERAAPIRSALLDQTVQPMVLLFRDRRLVDATPPARTLLSKLHGEGDWPRLSAWLAMRFADLDGALARAADEGRAEVTGAQGLGAARLRLVIEDLGAGLMRLTIADPAAENAGVVIDSQSLAHMEEELAILRRSVDEAPVLIWREAADGQITWANAAYLRKAEARSPDDTLWPMPRLIELATPTDADTPVRAKLEEADDAVRWFDCHVRPDGEGRMVFAVTADSTVRAERSLREFVQTLTKTFADLPVGLAIFDRQRNLQLFNPALIDLTGVATGFLTARPTLYAFLDRLREARMMPEPKDYPSWRNKIISLEAAAASGHHVETWTLPGGQTYRVTGRPHPDGAIAFLFEDITSEMSLTRRFRAELSLGSEMLDAVDEALAVFDASGKLVTMNRRYSDQWGADLRPILADHMAAWRAAAPAGQGQDALQHAISDLRGRELRRGATLAPNGGLMAWTVRPLSGARTLVSFHPETAGRQGDSGQDSTAGAAAAYRRPDEAITPEIGQKREAASATG